jgi:hypothetical protein
MNKIEYQITKKPEEEEVGDGGRKKLMAVGYCTEEGTFGKFRRSYGRDSIIQSSSH